MAGISKRARTGLGVPLFVNGPTTKGVLALGKARQNGSPMGIGEAHGPSFGIPPGIKTMGVGGDLAPR